MVVSKTFRIPVGMWAAAGAMLQFSCSSVAKPDGYDTPGNGSDQAADAALDAGSSPDAGNTAEQNPTNHQDESDAGTSPSQVNEDDAATDIVHHVDGNADAGHSHGDGGIVAPADATATDSGVGTETDGASSSLDAGSTLDSGAEEPSSLACHFHTDDVPEADAGTEETISIATNAFIGDYLVDEEGKPLYIFTQDLPGNCESAPVTTCFTDCAAGWPPYDARPRNLAEGLDDSLFGWIDRGDGSSQTTYMGWPLYTYPNDNEEGLPTGSIMGEGKRRLWFAARVNGYNLIIEKLTVGNRYLADGLGRTLYTYDQDTTGSESADPMSACEGSCRVDHPPARLSKISPVSSLNRDDFTIFARTEGGGTQLAFQGKPLYYSALDVNPGDANGALAGFAKVEFP